MGSVNVSILRDIWNDCRETWPQLVLTGLFFQLLALSILMPSMAFLLRFFLSLSGLSVATDLDPLLLLMQPVGWIGLLVIGSVFLTAGSLEFGSFMAIGFGVSQGRTLSSLEALQYVLPRAWTVIRFVGIFFLRTLLLIVPFFVAAGLVFTLLLSEHDISFYLAERPPAFWTAAVLFVLLGCALAALLVPRLISGLLALPILLFEGASPRESLSQGIARAQGRRWEILGLVAGWALSNLLLACLVMLSIRFLGRWLIPQEGGAILFLITILGFLLVAAVVAEFFCALLTLATLALLVVRLYWAYGGEQGGHSDWGEFTEEIEGSNRQSSMRRALVFGTGAAVLMAATLVGQLLRSAQLEDNVLVTAHRGASGGAPENTLAAVDLALEAGADFVEIDVQRTADNAVVVLHDSDLKRVGGVPLEVANATLRDLAAIDVGSWFGPGFTDQRVPTLAQILELCRDRATVNIELKYYGFDEELAPRVVEIVEEANMAEQVVVMSLSQRAVEQIRSLRPTWRSGLLVAVALGDLTTFEADFYAVHSKLATRSFVESSQLLEREVSAWTVNDPMSMTLMIGNGVNDLITDEPALAREVLQQIADLGYMGRLLLKFELMFGLEPKNVPVETEGGDAG